MTKVKKEFKLEDEDFNRIAEISANPNTVVQIIDGQVRHVTEQERATLFWQSIAVKYGFIPFDIETNLSMKSAQYFLAYPIELGSERLVNWCKLCNEFSGPETCGGCSRSAELGCAWFVKSK